jgi:hypothetical protein
MKTRASDHHPAEDAELDPQMRDPRPSRDIPQPVDVEQHWNELHRTNGRGQYLFERAKRHMKNASFADIAGAALFGVALGYVLFAPRRNNGLRQLVLGSLVPVASKGANDAWESIRHNRTLSHLGDRVTNFSDHVGDRAHDLAHRAAKLRRRW